MLKSFLMSGFCVLDSHRPTVPHVHRDRRRRYKWPLALVLFSALLLFFALRYVVDMAQFWPSTPSMPSDAALTAVFHRQRAAFDTLRDMIVSEPTICTVGPGYLAVRKSNTSRYEEQSYSLRGREWVFDNASDDRRSATAEDTFVRVGLSAGRYSKYLELLRTAQGRRVDKAYEVPSLPNYVQIEMASGGIVPSGERKSIEYFRDGIPSHYVVVFNTDVQTEPKGDWYMALVDGWYIHRCRW
jgi:hypothetical protein